jgi:deoxyribonuclease V
VDAQPWPRVAEELEALQLELAALRPPPWEPGPADRVGAVFVAFSTERGPAGGGDRAWAAAAVLDRSGATVGRSVVRADVEAGYLAGLLALREGAVLERAVRGLSTSPDVLLVNASGRDHPRRAGLALHLGAVLQLPTVGVTDRPLLATGTEPGPAAGSSAPLRLGRDVVGFRVRTRTGSRPVCAHAAWRTGPETARAVVLAVAGGFRTPPALRLARFLARSARARDEGRTPPGWLQDRRAEPLSR